jgi:hypothetical protein
MIERGVVVPNGHEAICRWAENWRCLKRQAKDGVQLGQADPFLSGSIGTHFDQFHSFGVLADSPKGVVFVVAAG